MSDAYEPNHLDWPGLDNVRDLAGMPTIDGGRIAPEALIRADSLDKLVDDEGCDLVREAGVSRIVDLRRKGESPRAHPFADDTTYVSVPVQDPADSDNQHLTLVEIYLTMLDLRPELFAQAVAAIADAPEGAVVVHCAGGKDRTGMVVALALSIAGAAPEVIAADYALTEARLAEADRAYLERFTDPDRRGVVRALQATPASNMLTVLDHLHTRYGGVDAYLRSGGMTDDQLERLRTRLVSPGLAGVPD
jgi:protein tyrosine/serine phosphatase